MTRRDKLTGLFLVFGFIVLKFYPFLLQNKVPIPFDIFAGGYWPWRLVDYGYVAGVPIKNPIVSDVVSQLYIWNDLAWSLIKQGLLPLWDRFSLLGYPYYANYHSAIFFPLNLIGLFTDSVTARSLVIFLTQLIAAAGMYGYQLHRKKSIWASILSSVVFVSAGLMTTDFLFASGSRAISFLPLIFWMTDLYVSKQNLRHLKFLAIFWMMLLLSGHFQMTIYICVIWWLYVFTRKTPNHVKISLGIYWTLGVLASMVQLAPTVELLSLSFRNSESYISQVNNGLLPIGHLITTFFAPDYFGNNSTGNYFGFWNYRESIGYLGLIPGFFMLNNLFRKYKDFFSLLFLFSLVMVFVPVIGNIIYKLEVPLISGSAASRWLFISAFSGALVAADGLEDFLKQRDMRFVLVFGSLLTGIIIWNIAEKYAYTTSEIDLSFETYFRNNYVSLRNLVIPCLGFFILFCTSVLPRERWWTKKLVPILLLTVISLDYLRFHFKFNSFVPRNIAPQIYDIKDRLSPDKRLSATSDELFPPNTSTMIRMPSVLGYDPLYPQTNGVFLNAINGEFNPNKVNRYFNKISNTSSQLIDYASIGYLATLTRDSDGLLSQKGEIPYFIDQKKWQTKYRDKEMLILENRTAKPLFFTAEQITKLDSDKHIEAMLKESDNTYVENLPETDIKTGSPLTYKIFENGNAIVDIEATTSGFLVYNQAYYPGWEVTIDDSPTKIYRTNYLFQGVIYPLGKHKIAWTFKPKSFYFGFFVTFSSLLVISLYQYEQKTR